MFSLITGFMPENPRTKACRLSAAGKYLEAIEWMEEKQLDGIGIEYYKLAMQMESRGDTPLALTYLKKANETLLNEIRSIPPHITDDATINKSNILTDCFAKVGQDFIRLTAQQKAILVSGQTIFNHTCSVRIVPMPEGAVSEIDKAFDFKTFTR